MSDYIFTVKLSGDDIDTLLIWLETGKARYAGINYSAILKEIEDIVMKIAEQAQLQKEPEND